ncbi:hypothetical protein N2152v2_010382 [Parachlorella kessleri]|uniref:RWP-RK transcription factor n=1 Tax=Parachlorella kessleri TaxID=3074 RepID=A0A292GC54_PARKE|nr:RWP-RK transcription factor [Parachlorella kessleri]
MDTTKGNKRTRRRRCQTGILAADITKEMLEQWFHLPSHEACGHLGISLSVLKRVCRKLGIPRWPYRTLTQNWGQEQQHAVEPAGRSASQSGQPPTPPSGSTAETDSQPSATEALRSPSAHLRSAAASIAWGGYGAAAAGSSPPQQQEQQQQRTEIGPSSPPRSRQQEAEPSQQQAQHASDIPAVKGPPALATLLVLAANAAAPAPPQPAIAGPSSGRQAPGGEMGCTGRSPGTRQQAGWLPPGSQRWGDRTDDLPADESFPGGTAPQANPKQGPVQEPSGWESVPGLQPAARRLGGLLEPPSPLQVVEPLPQLPSVTLPIQRQQQQQQYYLPQLEPRVAGPLWGPGQAPTAGSMGYQQLAARLVSDFLNHHPVAHTRSPSQQSPAAAAEGAAVGAAGEGRYGGHTAATVRATAGGGAEPQPARAALLSLLGLLSEHGWQRGEVQPAPCSPRQPPEQAQRGLSGWAGQGSMRSAPSAGGIPEEGHLAGADANWQRRPEQRPQREHWHGGLNAALQQEASWSRSWNPVGPQQGPQLPRAAALAELILRRQQLQQQQQQEEEEGEEGICAAVPARRPGQGVMPAWEHSMQEQLQAQQAGSYEPPYRLLGQSLEAFADQEDCPSAEPPLTERLYAVLRGLASSLQQEVQQAQQDQAPMEAAGPSLRPAQPVQAQHAHHAEHTWKAVDDTHAQHAQHLLTQRMQHAQRQQGAAQAALEVTGAPQASRMLQALLQTLAGRQP